MLSSGIGADVNAAVDQANRHLLAAEEALHTAMVATPEDRGNSSAGHMVLKPGGRVRTQSAAAAADVSELVRLARRVAETTTTQTQPHPV